MALQSADGMFEGNPAATPLDTEWAMNPYLSNQWQTQRNLLNSGYDQQQVRANEMYDRFRADLDQRNQFAAAAAAYQPYGSYGLGGAAASGSNAGRAGLYGLSSRFGGQRIATDAARQFTDLGVALSGIATDRLNQLNALGADVGYQDYTDRVNYLLHPQASTRFVVGV